MRSRSRGWLGGVAWAVLFVSAGARGADPAREAALARLWRACDASSNNHAAAHALCAAFEREAPGDPLAVVARGRGAWHLLKAGRPADGGRALETLLSTSGSVSRAADTMARRWLTRLDREAVAAALKTAYLDQIAYPPTLGVFDAWPESRRPPKSDRWDSPWEYRLGAFKHIDDTMGQRYSLESPALQGDSSLEKALARPYGTNAAPVIDRVMATTVGGGRALAVRLPGSSAPVVIQEGTAAGPYMLSYLGDRLAVFSDGDYWLLAPLKP
jgi:hypothetical protein